METSNNNWTLLDYDVVYREYSTKGPIAVAERLGRTVNSVVSRATKMGIGTNVPFSQHEQDIAREYGQVLGQALIFLLPNRTTAEIAELLKCVNG